MNQRAVGSAFSSAAKNYEHHACLQQQSSALIAQLIQKDYAKLLHLAWLDAGAGTGLLAQALGTGFAYSVALDIADGMLQQARRHYRHSVRASVANLPFAAHSFDIASANLVLQWTCPSRALNEIYRVLKPAGRLYFSVPLVGSLAEIAELWQRQQLPAPLNPLYSSHDWQQHILTSKLQIIEQHTTHYCLYYPSPRAALFSLKNIGAQHRFAQPAHLSKTAYRQMLADYQHQKTHRGVPLSYQIGTFVCTKASL